MKPTDSSKYSVLSRFCLVYSVLGNLTRDVQALLCAGISDSWWPGVRSYFEPSVGFTVWTNLPVGVRTTIRITGFRVKVL